MPCKYKQHDIIAYTTSGQTFIPGCRHEQVKGLGREQRVVSDGPGSAGLVKEHRQRTTIAWSSKQHISLCDTSCVNEHACALCQFADLSLLHINDNLSMI